MTLNDGLITYKLTYAPYEKFKSIFNEYKIKLDSKKFRIYLGIIKCIVEIIDNK